MKKNKLAFITAALLISALPASQTMHAATQHVYMHAHNTSHRNFIYTFFCNFSEIACNYLGMNNCRSLISNIVDPNCLVNAINACTDAYNTCVS